MHGLMQGANSGVDLLAIVNNKLNKRLYTYCGMDCKAFSFYFLPEMYNLDGADKATIEHSIAIHSKQNISLTIPKLRYKDGNMNN